VRVSLEKVYPCRGSRLQLKGQCQRALNQHLEHTIQTNEERREEEGEEERGLSGGGKVRQRNGQEGGSWKWEWPDSRKEKHA
jgi:hypothetical protein